MDQFIESIPFWYLLTAGVVLLAVDIFLTSTAYVGCIGVAVASVGGLSALGCSGTVQLVAFPVLVIGLSAVARNELLHNAPRKDTTPRVEDLIGATGTVLDVKPESASEGRAVIPGQADWRIRHARGVAIDAGARIRVVGVDGLVLLIEEEGDKDGVGRETGTT